jgi:hypothetical protein
MIDARTMRTLTWMGGFAWLVVAAYGVRTTVVDGDRDWKQAYAVFGVALFVAAAISVTVAARVSRHCHRPRLRYAGIVVSSVGVVASVVAWALPLWMTMLGVGLAMITAASDRRERRRLAALAAGPLVGLALLIAGIAVEVGRRDEWGDYPVAAGLALIVTALVAIVALFELGRCFEREPTLHGNAALPSESVTA